MFDRAVGTGGETREAGEHVCVCLYVCLFACLFVFVCVCVCVCGGLTERKRGRECVRERERCERGKRRQRSIQRVVRFDRRSDSRGLPRVNRQPRGAEEVVTERVRERAERRECPGRGGKDALKRSIVRVSERFPPVSIHDPRDTGAHVLQHGRHGRQHLRHGPVRIQRRGSVPRSTRRRGPRDREQEISS